KTLMKKTTEYSLWVLAFILKSVGASWDASYHFKYLRDFTQSPHIVNALGEFLIVFLCVYLWRKQTKEEKRSMRTIFSGMAVFLLAIPADELYHRAFGIDLTT